MFITMQPTTKIVDVDVGGRTTKARVWQGCTGGAVPVTVLVLRVACEREADNSELERELIEQAPPGPGARAIDLRFIL